MVTKIPSECGAHCSFPPSSVQTPTPLDVCLLGLMKSEVYKRKVDTLDELVTRILDDAAHIKKCEDQL